MEESMPIRIRLEFEDRRILSKSQRKDHLRRSWLLLRPKSFATVADVAAHISDVFSLRRTCPFGLLLYMDEFVLPPFESTGIFRDSDIIRVKKKAIKHRKIQIQEDAIQDTATVARQCIGIFQEQSRTKKRKICEDDCDINQISIKTHACSTSNRKRFDQLHANTDSPLHATDAPDKHEKAPLQASGTERMVEGRDEDAFKKTHKDAAPSNNWEVEVAKRISEASASHFIEIASDLSSDQMNQTENNGLLPQNGWDCWIANKNPAASWSWGVRGRNPSRNHDGKSGSYTWDKYLDSHKYSKSKW
ncbi:uncharacterized protein LOC141842017 [Curcuma longa]|uniref:uncharacterized protein LOC141842017 n=1 Tax=Curcuma longa TaxID=136217 RepID=UPI003D9EF861